MKGTVTLTIDIDGTTEQIHREYKNAEITFEETWDEHYTVTLKLMKEDSSNVLKGTILTVLEHRAGLAVRTEDAAGNMHTILPYFLRSYEPPITKEIQELVKKSYAEAETVPTQCPRCHVMALSGGKCLHCDYVECPF